MTSGSPTLRQAADLEARAAGTKVELQANLADALAGADVVLSLVVGSAATKVGEDAGQHLSEGQIFIDLNSIGPDAKKRVGDAVARGGGAPSWKAQ